MSMTQSAMRAAIRATNAVGRMLGRAGLSTVPLEEHSVLDAARRATHLDDFGDEAFREPLRMLLRDLDTASRLTFLGRVVARHDMVGLLANRLRLEDDRRRNPGIAAEEIRRPLFIVGLPRTGSTLLHHLLAQDPASRVAQAWEVMCPSPPPAREQYETDPRIARAARQLKWLDTLTPDFKAIHPTGAQLALECIAIMSPSFLCWRFNTMYRVPTYQEWLESQDFLPTYAFHRRFLQQLQWRAPAGHWVLKAPSHMLAFDALLHTYPDANIVQTHRDPLTVLASAASLTAVLYGGFTDEPDLAEIGREVARRWTMGIERALHVRGSGRVAGERFIDVHYHDLVQDPLAVVRRIYAHFGLPLSEMAQARMSRYLADNPKDKHGAHQYSLEAFGLDADALSRCFKAYREHFGIPSESDTAE